MITAGSSGNCSSLQLLAGTPLSWRASLYRWVRNNYITYLERREDLRVTGHYTIEWNGKIGRKIENALRPEIGKKWGKLFYLQLELSSYS